MFIVWSGLGFLVPVLGFVELMLLSVVPETMNHSLALALKFLIVLAGTLGIWTLGRKLSQGPGRVLIDPETNERIVLRTRHTLFWIPMEYWAFIVAIICVALIFAPASPPTTP